MSNRTKRWVRGIIEAIIHGGSSGVVSTFTVTVLDSGDWSPMTHFGKFMTLLGSTFSANGILRMCQYLNNNPLPPEGDTITFVKDGHEVVTTQTVSLNPLSKVILPNRPKP